jgi:urease gamma subunit
MHRMRVRADHVPSRVHRGLPRKHSGSNVLAKHYHAAGDMARDRTQIGVRLSDEAVSILAALQEHYAARAGLTVPVSQSQAVEIMLRETAKREGLKVKGATK